MRYASFYFLTGANSLYLLRRVYFRRGYLLKCSRLAGPALLDRDQKWFAPCGRPQSAGTPALAVC